MKTSTRLWVYSGRKEVAAIIVGKLIGACQKRVFPCMDIVYICNLSNRSVKTEYKSEGFVTHKTFFSKLPECSSSDRTA